MDSPDDLLYTYFCPRSRMYETRVIRAKYLADHEIRKANILGGHINVVSLQRICQMRIMGALLRRINQRTIQNKQNLAVLKVSIERSKTSSRGADYELVARCYRIFTEEDVREETCDFPRLNYQNEFPSKAKTVTFMLNL
ncbi:unnamed protein product [Caenorhabditis angaria]|uniref:Uncharacterized protein n=1 Tax=Caenorhabditis angaria TaxID=860376 RepID=A0A9P1NBX1_9PELO|nr:unnamed protein product [Caenorhabditis angaria]